MQVTLQQLYISATQQVDTFYVLLPILCTHSLKIFGGNSPKWRRRIGSTEWGSVWEGVSSLQKTMAFGGVVGSGGPGKRILSYFEGHRTLLLHVYADGLSSSHGGKAKVLGR